MKSRTARPLAGLSYTDASLDRAARWRDDPGWMSAQMTSPQVRVLPMWRDRCLVKAGLPVEVGGAEAGAVLGAATQTALLGLDEAAPVFAADLAGSEKAALELGAAEASADVRALAAVVPHSTAARLAYARGLLYWHRHHRFYGSCGSPTGSEPSGHLRTCSAADCGRQLFPRIEPAVIVLVESPHREPRCLLARHRGAGPDAYALIAGFVEVGESLEAAVRREVAEEAGVPIGKVAYRASQAWPFPAGLMVGFRARATHDDIAVDGSELIEARWFTREEVRERIASGPGTGPVDSIGGHLLSSWADDSGGPGATRRR